MSEDETDPEILLEKLEEEYCLSRPFYLDMEWYWYNKEKRDLLERIKDNLSTPMS